MRGLFNTSGAVTHQYEYAPYGEAQSVSGWPGNPLRFAARELDEGAGLYYVRARWYDPVLGRFISEDPIGLAGGINNYAYALNDPVNLSDPSGLCVKYIVVNGERVCALGAVVVKASSRAANAMRLQFLINKWSGISDRDSRVTSILGGGAPANPWQDDGSDRELLEPLEPVADADFPLAVWLPQAIGCPATVEGRALFPLPGRPHNPFFDLRRRGDVDNKRSGSFGYYQGEMWDTGRWGEPVHGTVWCRIGFVILHYSHGNVH